MLAFTLLCSIFNGEGTLCSPHPSVFLAVWLHFLNICTPLIKSYLNSVRLSLIDGKVIKLLRWVTGKIVVSRRWWERLIKWQLLFLTPSYHCILPSQRTCGGSVVFSHKNVSTRRGKVEQKITQVQCGCLSGSNVFHWSIFPLLHSLLCCRDRKIDHRIPKLHIFYPCTEMCGFYIF